MKKLLLVLMLPFGVFSQKTVSIHIEPFVLGSSFNLNTPFTGWDGKVVSAEHFNYYLSKLTIQHDGGQVMNLQDSVFIIKPADNTLNLGVLNLTTIEQVSFLVGVPQELNTQSGVAAQDISTYPENHPLSFQSPSMYWGWQSGYMHMIVGGKVDGDNDGVAEKSFELHNLGNSNQQQINLSVVQTNTSSSQIDIYLRCNLDKWLKNIDLEAAGIAHGETGVNAQVMDNAPTQNVFDQAANAEIQSVDQAILKVKSEIGKLTIDWQGMTNIASCSLVDLNGTILRNNEVNESNGVLSYSNLNAGVVLIQLLDKSGNSLALRKVLIP